MKMLVHYGIMDPAKQPKLHASTSGRQSKLHLQPLRAQGSGEGGTGCAVRYSGLSVIVFAHDSWDPYCDKRLEAAWVLESQVGQEAQLTSCSSVLAFKRVPADVIVPTN